MNNLSRCSFVYFISFSIIKNSYIIEDIEKYKNIIHLNKSKLNIDVKVLNNTNKLLNTNFQYFPLEMPWIFEKEKILKLYSEFPFLTSKSSNCLTFEIILYRLFLLKNFKNEYKLVEVDGNGFIYDFNKEHINLINYNYAISKYNLKNIFENTKMIVHNDR